MTSTGLNKDSPRKHLDSRAARKGVFLSLAVFLMAAGSNVQAIGISVAGVFTDKTLLMVNGEGPRTVRIGETTNEGVKVIAIDGDAVTLEQEGKRRTLRVGEVVASQKTNPSATAHLPADSRGQFFANATINAQNVRFLVDTGASMISLGISDARRMQIDTSRAPEVMVSTANGQTMAYQVKLSTVRVGGITMHNVDALVHPNDLPVALLGMSFLSRTEMAQDGSTMVLKRKY
ncbi:MAG: retroviral-like aspartic protease family protein [Betaproteobacteria bacterium]|nr:retroviral-like aspartic protease family protein [Betaproteobacteria bacterium]